MEIKMLDEDQISSVTLHFLASANIEPYRQYIEEHGGSVVQLAPAEEEIYRIDFPPGTLRKRNQVFGHPPEESFDVIFPDGGCLTWYANLKLDDDRRYNILVANIRPNASPAM